MGNAVKSFAKAVAKAAISGAGGAIPIIGGPLASWINSKFAKGSYDIGNPGVAIPDGAKTKSVSTPAQLKALIKANPDEAKAAGLTVDMVSSEVKEAKEQAKAVGGMIKMRDHAMMPRVNIPDATKLDAPPTKKFAKGTPALAVCDKGAEVKKKKPRTAAQLAATKKLVEMNRKRKEGK